MNRTPLIILTAISISLTAFLGGYWISQKDYRQNANISSYGSDNILGRFSESDSSDSSSPTPSQAEGLTLLSQREALSPTISSGGDSILIYEKNTGRVFEVNLANHLEKPVSESRLPNLLRTAWSPSKKEVISVFSTTNGEHYKYYSYQTKNSVDLGVDIKSLAFSPTGDQIAYFSSLGEDSGGIFISQTNGSGNKRILASRLNSAEVYWPSDDSLALKTTNSNGMELYSLSKTGELRKLLETPDKLEINWSSDGKKLLFSYQEDGSINLSYKDLGSGEIRSLQAATSANKCTWSIDGTSVICGLSQSSSSGDEIYEIKLDGTKKLIASTNSRISIGQIFLSRLEDYIIILNELDNKLYVLKK